MIFHLIFWGKYALARLGISDESGQGLVEYALILLLIAVAVIGTVLVFGEQLNATYERIVAEIPTP